MNVSDRSAIIPHRKLQFQPRGKLSLSLFFVCFLPSITPRPGGRGKGAREEDPEEKEGGGWRWRNQRGTVLHHFFRWVPVFFFGGGTIFMRPGVPWVVARKMGSFSSSSVKHGK